MLNDSDSFRVNSLGGDGVAAFRAHLIESVKAMRGFRERLPAGWVRLQEQLLQQSAQRPFLSVRAFRRVARQCGATALKSATAFLHETARIRFFGDLEDLEAMDGSDTDDDAMGDTGERNSGGAAEARVSDADAGSAETLADSADPPDDEEVVRGHPLVSAALALRAGV